jgi:class 3 adenylate cyclase/DNA-binding SARP family transcriptional activator/tetratricopeptide (TPR) repeat protein
VRGVKQRTLLSVLLVHANEPVSTGRLIEAIWGDRLPSLPEKTLQVHMAQLRKVLEPGRAAGSPSRLRSRDGGYELSLEPGELDLDRFEELRGRAREAFDHGDPETAAALLREALGLWRGPALAELAAGGLVAIEIARLEEVRLATLEGRIEADLALGRHAQLVPELEALVARHRLRERLCGQLMLALYGSGRQAEALRVYRETRDALVKELGIEPSRALRAVEQQILRQDPGLDVAATPRPPATPPREAVGPGPRTCRGCGESNPEQARFCWACGNALAVSTGEPLEVRKTVTVLFCDVTGSTSLGEQHDPEHLRRVMSRYYEEARAVLERHGGQVEKFIGDAVMAVFGIPILHEDDALRAVRAAVELREALSDLNDELERSFGVRIAVRTGVNSGEVIAGDPGGGHAFVAGDAVNVAKRLESAAGAGEILIGEPTFRLARDAVEAEAIDPLELKGKRERIAAYRLLNVTPGAPGHARRLDSPMVGRERELALLEDAYARAVRGQSCHLFTVLGTAGVGKSRLLAEALRSIAGDADVLTGACLPYGEGITFWPVLEIVKQATGISEDDSLDEARAKITALLEHDEAAAAVSERVTEVIGLARAAGTAEEGSWAVRKLLENLAQRRPVIVVFDDLNWAEPTLLDLLEHVAEWSRDAPILLICMSRPELLDLRPGWGGGKRNATTIFLEPLSGHESEVLIDNLVGGPALVGQVRERIQEASAGNPLFVEEMVSMLIDEGLLQRENGRWAAVEDLSRVRVPTSIQVLLASRLDQLSATERRVLERGAVEGNVFHLGAIEALGPPEDRPDLASSLSSLTRKDLVRPHRPAFAGEQGYGFRHPLIREATYEALPKQVRSELHEGYADWLEQRAGEYEEIVGYHLEQAFLFRGELGPVSEEDLELGARASDLLASAGRRALARGDVPAAVDLLARAVLLQPEGSGARLELLPELGAALRESGEPSRAEEYLEEAFAEARATGNRGVELAALIERAALLLLSDPGTSDRLLEEVEAAVPALEELGDHRVLAAAWTLVGLRFGLWRGRFARGEEALERALVHAREAGDRRQEAAILGYLCFAASQGPTPLPAAIERCNEILAQASGDPMVEAGVARNLAPLEARRGRFDEARRLADRAREGFEELGLQLVAQAAATLASGDIELLAGDYEAAERSLRAGLEALERMGERGYLSSVAAFLAEALYRQQRLDEAAELAARARETASEDDLWSQALSRGTGAKVLAAQGRAAEAERLAEEAVELVEATDALDLHGSALLGLAEVLLVTGRKEDAAARADEALALFERKGNEVSAQQARALIARAGLASVTAGEDPGDPAS